MTLKHLAYKFDVSETAVRHVMHGKSGKGGLLTKVRGIFCETETVTDLGEDQHTSKSRKIYTYVGKGPSIEDFGNVAHIDEKTANELTDSFKNEHGGAITPLPLPEPTPNLLKMLSVDLH